MQEKSTQPRCRISTLFAEASLAKLFQSLGDGEASQIPEGPCSLKSLESMLEKGLITEEEYAEIDTILLEKYRPYLGTLLSENA